jgi:hypothetical protein
MPETRIPPEGVVRHLLKKGFATVSELAENRSSAASRVDILSLKQTNKNLVPSLARAGADKRASGEAAGEFGMERGWNVAGVYVRSSPR